MDPLGAPITADNTENIFYEIVFFLKDQGKGFKTHVVRASNSSWARRYIASKLSKFREIHQSESLCNSRTATRLRFTVSDVNKRCFFSRASPARLRAQCPVRIPTGMWFVYRNTQNRCQNWFFRFSAQFSGLRGFRTDQEHQMTCFLPSRAFKISPQIENESSEWCSEYFGTRIIRGLFPEYRSPRTLTGARKKNTVC